MPASPIAKRAFERESSTVSSGSPLATHGLLSAAYQTRRIALIQLEALIKIAGFASSEKSSEAASAMRIIARQAIAEAAAACRAEREEKEDSRHV